MISTIKKELSTFMDGEAWLGWVEIELHITDLCGWLATFRHTMVFCLQTFFQDSVGGGGRHATQHILTAVVSVSHWRPNKHNYGIGKGTTNSTPTDMGGHESMDPSMPRRQAETYYRLPRAPLVSFSIILTSWFNFFYLPVSIIVTFFQKYPWA